MSFALSFAEAIRAESIFIGAHQEDYSGYPDCRREFFEAFRQVIAKGTAAGARKKKISILVPLQDKKKAEIIRLGKRLGVPFELTWSCYGGKSAPCNECGSCYYRAKGFREAGMVDPALKSR